MPSQKNFPGEKFGHLTITRRDGIYAVCRCDCGNIEPKKVRMGNLKSGRTTSCGCKQDEFYRTKAGLHPRGDLALHRKLRAMHASIKQKCYNKNNPSFQNYGAYGVGVEPEWAKAAAFVKWAVPKYKEGTFLVLKSLGDFGPDNCEFVKKAGNLHLVETAATLYNAPPKIPPAPKHSRTTDDGYPLTEAAAATGLMYVWFATKQHYAHKQGKPYTLEVLKRQVWERAVGLIK